MGVFITLLILTALLIGFGLISRRQEVEVIEYPSSIERIRIDLPMGGVRVRPSRGGPIRVVRTLDYMMRRPALSERVEEEELVISPVRPRRGLLGSHQVRYEIDAPPQVALRIRLGGGTLEVAGIQGEVDLETAAGTLSVAELGGPARLVARAGFISGRSLASSELHAVNDAGSVQLTFIRPPALLEATTHQGNVDLEVPDEGYRVMARTEAGGADVAIVSDPDATRMIVARSSTGSIRVRPHSPFAV